MRDWMFGWGIEVTYERRPASPLASRQGVCFAIAKRPPRVGGGKFSAVYR
jgi:hypothetical protein